MYLREFVSLAQVGEGGMAYVAVQRKDRFEGCSGDIWCDTVMGFSWCTRKGYELGKDWGKGKAVVKEITTVHKYNKDILCAVID